MGVSWRGIQAEAIIDFSLERKLAGYVSSDNEGVVFLGTPFFAVKMQAIVLVRRVFYQSVVPQRLMKNQLSMARFFFFDRSQ